MPEAFDADEVGDVVARRADFLASLAAGPKYNRDLQDELGVSRSTAYKALRELEENSLVERTDEGFAPTLAGRLLLGEYQRYRANVEDICRGGSLLTVLPRDAVDSIDVFRGSSVVFPERHAPNKPVGIIEDAVRDADAICGMSPVLLPVYVEVFYESIVNGPLEADLLLERPVVEHMQEQYTDELNAVLDTTQLSLWETDQTLPFGLIIVEKPTSEVLLIVYDAGGELRGIVANDTPEAVAWAYEVFHTYQSSGKRVEPQTA